MERAPIRSGAIRPQGRPRRAMSPVLLRLVALAGLAFAGWVAFSALNGAAHAAQQDTPNRQTETSAPRHNDLPGRNDVLPLDDVPHHVSGSARGAGRTIGARPVGYLSDRVGEIGDQPLRYLRERRQDALDGKDQVVQRLEELTDAAGVPLVRIPDIRRAPVVGGGIPQDIPGSSTVDGGPLAQQPSPSTQETGKAAPGGNAGAHGEFRAAPPGIVAGDTDRRDAGDCAGCQSDRHGPTLPAGQDEPGSSSGGGHQLSPIADLMTSGRYPTVPAALDPNTFHRTALTDVSAPGGPSVVPD